MIVFRFEVINGAPGGGSRKGLERGGIDRSHGPASQTDAVEFTNLIFRGNRGAVLMLMLQRQSIQKPRIAGRPRNKRRKRPDIIPSEPSEPMKVG